MNFRSLFVFLLLFSQAAVGQKYYFENYSVKEGLGQSDVYTLYQDKQNGMVWLGTKAGLSKFDGKVFTNYTSDDGLATGGVHNICADSLGNLWLGHIGGALSFYANGQFKQVEVENLKHDITSLTFDHRNNLWFSTSGSGCFKISNPYEFDKEKNIEHLAGDKGLSDRVFKIVSTKSYGLMFMTDFGVKIQKDTSFVYAQEIFSHWPQYFSTITVFEDSEKRLWLGSYNGGVYVFNQEKDKKPKIYDVRDGLSYNWISTISEDSKGQIWIGTWGGGVTVIHDGQLLVYNKNTGLNGEKIRDIIEDYEGNILIGSRENGLFIFRGPYLKNYNALFKSDVEPHIYAIHKQGKRYYLATDEGLMSFDPSNIQQENVQYYREGDDLSIMSNQTRLIAEDKDQKLWIGTWGGGVYQLDPSTGKLENNYLINNQSILLSQGNVTALTIDQKNRVYVGSFDGIIYYEINTGNFDVLTQRFGLAGNDITALYTAPSGMVWVGSRGKGISIIKKDTIEALPLLKDITPTSFYASKNGVWVGTEGLGVYLINENKEVLRLTKKKGLISDLVNTISEGNDGNIYFGTNMGISKYDPKTEKIRNFSVKDGFSAVEVKPGAQYMDKNSIWIGTVNGLYRIFPEEIRSSSRPPKLFLSRLRVNLKDRSLNDNPVFSFDENAIIFDYKAISISDADNLYYQVMLEGADKEWQPITKNTFSNYSGLPFGEYTFKVKAVNALVTGLNQ